VPDWEAEAEQQRRANLVSLRTLGQRPRAAGRTADGTAVFEVNGVRLVLGAADAHFNRLVACATCGREVAGAPVRALEDLDAPPSPATCAVCEPDPPDPPQGGEPSSLARRLAALEARLDDLVEALDSRPTEAAVRDLLQDGFGEALVQARSEVADSLAQARVEQVDALSQAHDLVIAQLRSEVASSREEGEAGLARVEDQVRQTFVGLAKLMDAQRSEVTDALGSRPTEDATRALVESAVAEAVTQARAGHEEALGRAKAEMTAAVARRPTEDATRTLIEAVVAGEVARVREELAAALDIRLTEQATQALVESAVAHAVGQARANHEEALADAQAEMATAVARRPTEAATRALVDTAVQGALAQLRAELVAGLRDRLTEEATRRLVDETLTQTRADAGAALSALNDDVSRTMREMADELDGHRAELLALTDSVVAAQSQLERLSAAVAEGWTAVTERDQVVSQDHARLSAMVGALRSDLEEAIGHAAQETAALTGARAELAGAQAELERRVAALAEAVEAGEGGLQAVEQRILEELYRVNVRLERMQPPVRAARADEASLVETLDAQLRAAESRLAAQAGQPGDRG
jgi:predicted  nucleic acid-binding Zn-ribbon protein